MEVIDAPINTRHTMNMNTENTEAQNENGLPRVCEKTHLTGAIFVVTVETEAGIVTVRDGVETDNDVIIVEEREGDLTEPVAETVSDSFGPQYTAHIGGVGA